jgi:imidazolonepropionase-like amidohydrolase
MNTIITNARVFDGERVLDATNVVLDGPTITAVGGHAPTEGTVIDARGGTLLPGLIDAHVHTSLESLRDALRFGVTTELEMMGHWTPEARKDIAERDDVADLRSAGLGVSAPGGHPSELMPDDDDHHGDDGHAHGGEDADGPRHDFDMPAASTPAEAAEFVAQRVAEGSDYIKIMIEEGGVLASPGLPMLDNDTLAAAVRAAHDHGKLVVAHALTIEATQQAIAAGVDGLTHLFLDRPHTPEIIDAIAGSGVFVTACLCLNSSIMGGSGADFAADPRVGPKLSPEWLDTLSGRFNTYPQGDFDDVLASIAALREAGVDILAGTDASVPAPNLGGLAHGASVHHELQLLVSAGLTPLEALRAATSTPARRFGLTDHGRIEPGARADLLLVDGDPTIDITKTLSIRGVWRRGVPLATLS